MGRIGGGLLLGLLLFGPGGAMATGIDRDEFAGRRRQVLREMDGGVLLIRNSPETGSDEFQANRDFFYLTGISRPGGVLLLAPGGVRVRGAGGDYYGGEPLREILFLPETSATERRWDGPKLGPGETAREISGIETVRPTGGMDRILDDALGKASVLYYSAPAVGAGAELSRSHEWLRNLRDRFFWLQLRDASRLIEPMRMVKSPAEVRLVQAAVDLTGEGIREVLERVEPGMLESEVEGILARRFLTRGARFSFEPIVGSGRNSTILHYRDNIDRMEAGEVVVLDIGVRIEGYASDISRSFPVSGRFSSRQAEVYRLVLEAQRAGIAAVRPGATLRDVHRASFRVIEAAGYGEYFVHGTTHHLGLDVHDVADRDAPLRPGMIITVEPGIYIPDESLGVRIEDDLVVTGTGNRVLSEAIPRELEAIESAMAH